MSLADWRLLRGGRIVAARRDDGLLLEVDLPPLARRATLRLRSVERFEWRPSAHTWEDDDIGDLDAIAGAALTIEGARWSRSGRQVVLELSDGTILAEYERAELESELSDGWRAHWARWCMTFDEDVHPHVRQWLATGSGPERDAVLEAWRAERTSDLAALVTALDDSTAAPELDSLEAFDRWGAAHPVGAARELARAAHRTFEVWSDAEVAAAWWERITQAIAGLDADADPRIGPALLASLYSPSDWWFRVDQVAHIAGPFEAKSDEPSFADHLFRQLEVHADAGTPRRSLAVRKAILPECDCNGAEMGERLQCFAERIRGRYPEDRELSREGREALYWRTRIPG